LTLFLVDETSTLDAKEGKTSSDEALSRLTNTILRYISTAMILADVSVDHVAF
jgi:hypothetical protein